MTQTWPHVAPEQLAEGQPICVLAPHPDDESLGCGGLLAHAFATHGAHVVCLTDGGASHPASEEWPRPKLARRRHEELTAAIQALGGAPGDLTWLGLPDGKLAESTAPEVAEQIAGILRRIGAAAYFAPAVEDNHVDHKATAKIAQLVASVLPDLTLYTYPVWSRWDEPDFDGTIRGHRPFSIDTTPWRAAKRRAIEAHTSQLPGGVPDDPDGFAMEPGFVESFINQDEIFWRTHP